MVPGIIGMTLFGGQLMNALRDPGPGTLAILAVIVLLVVGLGALIRRRLRRLHQDREHAPEPEEPSS
jgi:hypothetical protein